MTLDSVAEVVATTGPSEIHRADQVGWRSCPPTSGHRPRQRPCARSTDVAENPAAWRDIGRLHRRPGAGTVAVAASLLFAFGLAIFLVYLVMASQFESLLHPFVILFTIPLAMVGAILALMVTGSTVSVVVFIGLILLVGWW